MTAYIGCLLTPLLFTEGYGGLGYFAGFARHTEGQHCGPVKMQRKISSIQQLLLEGLFFKESFCHEGSSQIHFPMAHIKEAEVLIICETSHNCVML